MDSKTTISDRFLKIIYLISDIGAVGGQQRVAIIKANELAKRGHDVTILSYLTINKNSPANYDIDDRVKIASLEMDYSAVKSVASLSWLRLKRYQFSLFRQFFKNENPDIVILTEPNGSLPPVATLPFRSALVYEAHFPLATAAMRRGYSLWQRMKIHIANFVTRCILSSKVNRFVVLTEERRKRCGFNKRKVVVIPNPLTIEPLRSTGETKVIVAMGHLNARKNHHALIDVMRLVAEQHPDWELHIWGAGPQRDELQRHIDRLKLGKNVRLMGTTTDAAAVFSQAAIFASTSLSETFHLVVLEAMASGVPIVAYHNEGNDSLLAVSGAGVLLDAGDIEGMAHAIGQLISDKSLRDNMGARGIERSRDFALDAIIDRYETLYCEVAAKHNT